MMITFMYRRVLHTVALLSLAAGLCTTSVRAEVSYGEELYEQHCRHCHKTSVFVRDNSKVHGLEDLEHFVVRWSEFLRLQWDEHAIHAVTDHLNRQHYHFKATEKLH